MSFTRTQVARAVGTTRSAIEKMIHRGHFGTDLYPAPSEKYGWTAKDAVRLAVAIELAPVMGRSYACMVSDHANYDSPCGQYLVARKLGWLHVPGGWKWETVSGAELLDLLEKGDVRGAVVLNLDVVVANVVASLESSKPHAVADQSEEN